MLNRDDNLALSHIRARDLTPEEAANVSGGVHTLTLCSVEPPDGDPGECGGV